MFSIFTVWLVLLWRLNEEGLDGLDTQHAWKQYWLT